MVLIFNSCEYFIPEFNYFEKIDIFVLVGKYFFIVTGLRNSFFALIFILIRGNSFNLKYCINNKSKHGNF